jgi:hypothetical protein
MPQIILKKRIAPSAPSAGKLSLYFKDDNRLYYKDELGTEFKVTIQLDINSKVDANVAIVAGTATKISYDAKGLVTGGAALTAADVPILNKDTTGNAATATTAGKATNLAGGSAGKIAYQSAADTTAFLVEGTVGQVLTSGGAGVAPSWAEAGGGLKNLTETLHNTAPNDSYHMVSIAATGAGTDIGISLVAKGFAAITAQVPDNTAAGGNARGARSMDWQRFRNNPDEVASGQYSVLAGGFANKLASNFAVIAGGRSNRIEGAYSVVGGGNGNSTNTGTYSVVGGGGGNSSTGNYTSLVGGDSNTINNSNYGSLLGGEFNIVSGDCSSVLGGSRATTFTRGQVAFSSGSFSVARGTSQWSVYSLFRKTIDATTLVLTSTGLNANNALEALRLPFNSLFLFKGMVVARQEAAGLAVDSSAWEIKALVRKGGLDTEIEFVGTPTITLVAQTTGASAWTVTLEVDNVTYGAMQIKVTGEAARTIRWAARLDSVEVTNA